MGVVATIISHSVGVEIIQESKHFIDFVDSEVYMTRRGQINALLFIFRTSKNYKLTERVKFTFNILRQTLERMGLIFE